MGGHAKIVLVGLRQLSWIPFARYRPKFGQPKPGTGSSCDIAPPHPWWPVQKVGDGDYSEAPQALRRPRPSLGLRKAPSEALA